MSEANPKPVDPDDAAELDVTFIPSLYLQRHVWILRTLRRERVCSVIDVGCGEGQLLESLCNPAPRLASPPPPLDTEYPVTEGEQYLHLHTIHALDISAEDLKIAIELTKPPPAAPSGPRDWSWQPRWDEMDVKVWLGGLESVNREMEGVDCIVAMEVIEHLPHHVLDYFAPVLLGAYHPRLLLMTTPSYTFNARFYPPNFTGTRGIPDPTHRTTRVFRHPDHKFEWTPQECKEWCEAAAHDWGYDVLDSGVGKASEKDPWGRDADCGFASQAVSFRRREGDDWVKKRKQKSETWLQNRVSEAGSMAHKLLVTHKFAKHEKARCPVESERVGSTVKEVMLGWKQAEVGVSELWREERVRASCGGWLEVLLDAVVRNGAFEVRKDYARSKEDWRVVLNSGVPALEDVECAKESRCASEWSESDDLEDGQRHLEGDMPEMLRWKDEEAIISPCTDGQAKATQWEASEGWGRYDEGGQIDGNGETVVDGEALHSV